MNIQKRGRVYFLLGVFLSVASRGAVPSGPPQPNERIYTEPCTMEYLVVGGGMGGLCLTKSAEAGGIRSIKILSDRPLLGGRNSSEGREPIGARTLWPDYPNLGKPLERIRPVRDAQPDEDGSYFEDERKKLAFLEVSELEWPICAAELAEGETNRLAAVIVRSLRTGGLRRLRAGVFVDATPDGALRKMVTRSGRGLAQATGDELPFGAMFSVEVTNLVFTGCAIDADEAFFKKHGSVHDESLAGEVAGMVLAEARWAKLPIAAALTDPRVLKRVENRMALKPSWNRDYHAYPPQICEWYDFPDAPRGINIRRTSSSYMTNIPPDIVWAIEKVGQSHWNAHPQLKNEVIPLSEAVKRAEGVVE